jgi:hypothetical protein
MVKLIVQKEKKDNKNKNKNRKPTITKQTKKNKRNHWEKMNKQIKNPNKQTERKTPGSGTIQFQS